MDFDTKVLTSYKREASAAPTEQQQDDLHYETLGAWSAAGHAMKILNMEFYGDKYRQLFPVTTKLVEELVAEAIAVQANNNESEQVNAAFTQLNQEQANLSAWF